MSGRTTSDSKTGNQEVQKEQSMAERQTLDILAEKKTKVVLPERNYIFRMQREKNRIVVRTFEECEGILICLDEEYALNEDDAAVILNIMYHRIHKFQLN